MENGDKILLIGVVVVLVIVLLVNRKKILTAYKNGTLVVEEPPKEVDSNYLIQATRLKIQHDKVKIVEYLQQPLFVPMFLLKVVICANYVGILFYFLFSFKSIMDNERWQNRVFWSYLLAPVFIGGMLRTVLQFF